MAAYNTIDGDLIQVYLNGTLIANGTDCKIAFKRANREVTTKDGGNNAQYEYTKGSWSVSGGYLHTELGYTTAALQGLWRSRTKVVLKFGSTQSGANYYQGTALIDSLDMSGPQKANVTGTYTFTGDGDCAPFTNP